MSGKAVVNPLWHLIDARGQVVGRLAAAIAPILRGKHKPTFAPNVACGDYIVVINAKDVVFTGRKMKNKKYYWHTGYPGGLKERSPEDQMRIKPEEVLRHAVLGMLPKNNLRKTMSRMLKIYPGSAHPHTAQIGDKQSIV
mmetsp:Transcript_4960/g.6811  ORF Transcript_4960/g.6811 Transcript_4960/m.6811 type:complete len:140 (-) Transcript_4960:126-545(-)